MKKCHISFLQVAPWCSSAIHVLAIDKRGAARSLQCRGEGGGGSVASCFSLQKNKPGGVDSINDDVLVILPPKKQKDYSKGEPTNNRRYNRWLATVLSLSQPLPPMGTTIKPR